MKKYFRYLKYYLKYHREINELFDYSLKGKNGEQVDENWGWFDKTTYWLFSE